MNLDQIGVKHHCDKSSIHHNYTPVYEYYFEPLRNEPITLLELGFGGYEYPDRGGAGAKMWADYLPNAQIITIDRFHKFPLNHPRIHFHEGEQDSDVFLKAVIEKHGQPDIIIDDASHVCHLTLSSFEILFPLLKNGGIYVIEDSHTSHWPDHGYGGGTHSQTTLNQMKRLTDHLNAEHNGLQPYPDIKAIHFWRQQVFILKS